MLRLRLPLPRHPPTTHPPQYASWNGVASPDDFYASQNVRDAYKRHLAFMVRVCVVALCGGGAGRGRLCCAPSASRHCIVSPEVYERGLQAWALVLPQHSLCANSCPPQVAGQSHKHRQRPGLPVRRQGSCCWRPRRLLHCTASAAPSDCMLISALLCYDTPPLPCVQRRPDHLRLEPRKTGR